MAMTANNLTAISDQLAAAVESAAQHVVAVQARSGPGSSGIVWRDGLILTSSEGIRVEEGIRITRPDGRTVEARLRAADPGADLALLEADTSGIAAAPSPASASAIRAGHLVLAVGRTAHTGPIAAFGMVSGIAGEWKSWRGGRIDPFVRLDLAAYPTQSGAALVNCAGHWLGLVSTGLSRSSVLAVTQATIDLVMERLMRPGGAERGFLGAALQPVALPGHLIEKLDRRGQSTGIMIVGLEPGGPAERSGLLLGDLLVATGGGTSLDDPSALAELLDGAAAGDTVHFHLIRGGEAQHRAVLLGARPASRRRPS